MKMTLLEIVQDILNDMDSDEVNSISDTVESQQVAQSVKTTFYEFINRHKWTHLHKVSALAGLGDSAKPTHLYLPENALELTWLKFNVKTEAGDRDYFDNLTYKSPEAFLRMCTGRDSSESNIEAITDYSGVVVNIKNDSPPQYWTSFDDKYIILDAWVKDISATVTSSQNQVRVYLEPTWTHTDSAVPDLPSEHFSAFLAEAKSVCFNHFKQAPNAKVEQQSKRQMAMLSQRDWVAKGGIKTPNFGRKRGKYSDWTSEHNYWK